MNGEFFIETSVAVPIVEAVGYVELRDSDQDTAIASWLYKGGKNNDSVYLFIFFRDGTPTSGCIASGIDLGSKMLDDVKSYDFDEDSFEFVLESSSEKCRVSDNVLEASEYIRSRLLSELMEYDNARDDFVLRKSAKKVRGTSFKKGILVSDDCDQDQLDWIRKLFDML
jgi:hypothetical protein